MKNRWIIKMFLLIKGQDSCVKVTLNWAEINDFIIRVNRLEVIFNKLLNKPDAWFITADEYKKNNNYNELFCLEALEFAITSVCFTAFQAKLIFYVACWTVFVVLPFNLLIKTISKSNQQDMLLIQKNHTSTVLLKVEQNHLLHISK